MSQITPQTLTRALHTNRAQATGRHDVWEMTHRLLQQGKGLSPLSMKECTFILQAAKRLKNVELLDLMVDLHASNLTLNLAYNASISEKTVSKIIDNILSEGSCPSYTTKKTLTRLISKHANEKQLENIFNRLSKLPNCRDIDDLYLSLHHASKTTPALTEQIYRAGSASVVRYFASDRETPVNILNDIAARTWTDHTIHEELARNESTPVEALKKLIYDPTIAPYLSKSAIANLKRNVNLQLSVKLKPVRDSELEAYLLDEDKAIEMLRNPTTTANVIEVIYNKYGSSMNMCTLLLKHPNITEHLTALILNSAKDRYDRERYIDAVSFKFEITIVP